MSLDSNVVLLLPVSEAQKFQTEAALDSNVVLLLPETLLEIITFFRLLQIPMWFYYYRSDFKIVGLDEALQIPMWFYYYKHQSLEMEQLQNFRFQCGSIITRKRSSLMMRNTSLQIPMWFYYYHNGLYGPLKYEIPLDSNVVLLLLGVITKVFRTIFSFRFQCGSIITHTFTIQQK